MTVRELIEKLQAMPEDLPVFSTADWDFVERVELTQFTEGVRVELS